MISSSDIFGHSYGASNRIRSLAIGMDRLGYRVQVLHLGQTGDLEGTVEVRHIRASFVSFLLGHVRTVRAITSYLYPFDKLSHHFLREFAADSKPDIIQFETPYSFVDVGTGLKKDSLTVLDEHNIEYLASKDSSGVPFLSPWVRLWEHDCVRSCDVVLTVSESDKKAIARLYGRDAGSLILVPNGVDCYLFGTVDRFYARRVLGIPNQESIVFFHGLLGWKPNIEAVETILEELSPRLPHVKFLVAGEGLPSRIVISARIHRNVILLGFIENLPLYLAASDV